MKMLMKVFTFLSLLIISQHLAAEDTLPNFSVKNRYGKVIISWLNNYPVIKQISIQRSADSLKGFKTILTVPDPGAITNGFLDARAPDTQSFYRLYLLLENGKFVFTRSGRPQVELLVDAQTGDSKEGQNRMAEVEAEIARRYGITSTNGGRRRSGDLKADSLKASVPRDTYRPSSFVYTNGDGNITIALPDNKNKDYLIKFFEENGLPLFEVKQVKERMLTLDKSNFLHNGWFHFELYEDDQLKEKHKFYIPKEK